MEKRKGQHGGAREGAGRKPKPVQKLAIPPTEDPIAFLLAVMNDPEADAAVRVRAATTAARLKSPKAGKKGERKQAAEAAATGKFKPAAPPKLVVNNR